MKPTVPRGLLVGFLGAAASLTKPVFLLYPPLFAVAWLALWYLRRRSAFGSTPGSDSPAWPWKPAVAVVAAMVLTIAPWTVRNYYATDGHFVIITTGMGDSFLRGYVFSETDYILLRKPPYTDAEIRVNGMFMALAAAAGTEWRRDDVETDKILTAEAKRKLQAEPLEFVRKFSVGLFTFWYQMTSLANSAIVGLGAAAAWALALVGLRRARREGQQVWLFLLPAIYLNVTLAALLALGRYSAPVIPALLVASAFGIDTLLSGIPWLRRRDAASG
jgi:hypothetical protein